MSHTFGTDWPVADTRDVRRAWIASASLPLLLVLGFVLGSALLGDPNDPAAPHNWAGAWRVVLLWATLEVTPVFGIYWGARGVRRQEPGARGALTANAIIFVFFLGVTLVAGLADTFN